VTYTPVLETNSIELLHRFALSGAGISFLPRSTCHESLVEGKLIAIPLADQGLSTATLEVITLASRKLPLPVETFLETLVVLFRQNPTGSGRAAAEQGARRP
jgi:DNA-binding transcriptional LysR family regulator